jgi:aromatic-L-amino-acid/L-tryptophan decarboxylase
MSLRYYGARRIAAAIGEDIAMAAYMAELVAASDDLELLAGPNLSICCFRHVPRDVREAELNAHNERLLAALQRDGRVYLSNATVSGRLALRACITNFRTTRSDVERRSRWSASSAPQATRGRRVPPGSGRPGRA